jgi:hypothetical protein
MLVFLGSTCMFGKLIEGVILATLAILSASTQRFSAFVHFDASEFHPSGDNSLDEARYSRSRVKGEIDNENSIAAQGNCGKVSAATSEA